MYREIFLGANWSRAEIKLFIFVSLLFVADVCKMGSCRNKRSSEVECLKALKKLKEGEETEESGHFFVFFRV